MRITTRPTDVNNMMMRAEPDALAIARTSKPRTVAQPRHRDLPPTCAFASQAQVLCVGTSVVYRVLIDVAVASSCDRQTPVSQPRKARAHRWSIAMTHAKLAHVCTQIQQLVSSLYFAACHECHDDHDSRVFHQLYRPLADALVRYDDLCRGFTFSASGETMMVTQCLLVAFLHDCWRAFETVVPLACIPSTTRPHALDVEVRQVYAVMQDLFMAPHQVIEASCMYATALSNIQEFAPTPASRDCSICLDPTSTTDSVTVRLPCHHVFHEQCIMQWMQQSLTCPDCRQFLGQ